MPHETQVAECLNTILSSSKIVVLSKPSCVQCDQLKKHLSNSVLESSYKIVMINEWCEDVDILDIIAAIKTKHTVTSYPICFYDGQFIETNDLKKKLTKNVELSFKVDEIDNL